MFPWCAGSPLSQPCTTLLITWEVRYLLIASHICIWILIAWYICVWIVASRGAISNFESQQVLSLHNWQKIPDYFDIQGGTERKSIWWKSIILDPINSDPKVRPFELSRIAAVLSSISAEWDISYAQTVWRARMKSNFSRHSYHPLKLPKHCENLL